jgi:hypothetical protein
MTVGDTDATSAGRVLAVTSYQMARLVPSWFAVMAASLLDASMTICAVLVPVVLLLVEEAVLLAVEEVVLLAVEEAVLLAVEEAVLLAVEEAVLLAVEEVVLLADEEAVVELALVTDVLLEAPVPPAPFELESVFEPSPQAESTRHTNREAARRCGPKESLHIAIGLVVEAAEL